MRQQLLSDRTGMHPMTTGPVFFAVAGLFLLPRVADTQISRCVDAVPKNKVAAFASTRLEGQSDVDGKRPKPQSAGVVRPKADEPAPRTDENSMKAHEALLKKAQLGATTARIDVYFIGDSITRRWGCTDRQYRELYEHWKRNFYGWNAANFGWGGDTTSNILWRLNNGELAGLQPKVFVILAGTNNLGSSPENCDPAELARGIKAIVDTCQRQVPDAKIILTAIFPRNDHRAAMPVIRRVNELISQFADGKRVQFLDVNDKLARADGSLKDGMMMDGLHPTLRGYQAWADGLRPILSEWLGPPATVDHAPPATGDPSLSRD
jgi:lysophospholipase L1-like esterase